MSGQTIILTGGQLELNNTGGTQLITGPAAGVTVSGGGLNRVFEVDQSVTASLSGLTITGGGGTSDRGGGLLNLGTVTLTNCTISNNSTSKATFPGSGGGLSNFGTAILSGCTISGNTATSNGGGVANLGTITMTNCTVSGNTANGFFGGGVYNKGSATLTGCTISGNISPLGTGGGLSAFGGTLNLSNCTVSGNIGGGVATLGGGGGIEIASGATVNLFDCTVSGNTAYGQGGGIENNGTVALTGTIVAGNKSSQKPAGPSDISGSNVSGTFNLIGTGGSGGLTNGVGGNIVGVANAGLGPLGNYGGPIQTLALLAGSPAIGKGTQVGGITTDGRGLARGAVVDIGAFQTSLVVESTLGSINKTPAQLTLPGAVSLAKDFAGPVAISFDPAVFTGGQTIALTGSQLELSKLGTIPSWTITGPANGVTVNGSGRSRVFQVDTGVTASISGLTITGGGGTADRGGGLLNLGNVTLTNCTLTGNTGTTNGGALASYGTKRPWTNCIVVSGNTWPVTPAAPACSARGELWLGHQHSKIINSTTAIQVINRVTATISGGSITGNGTGILVGSSVTDTFTVTVHDVDLSNDTVGISNNSMKTPVDATLNWWGSQTGPNTTGASKATGLFIFSPWLGDAQEPRFGHAGLTWLYQFDWRFVRDDSHHNRRR